MKRMVVLLSLLPILALAATLVWNPSSTAIGYKIYYGYSSRAYTTVYNAGLRTNLPMTLLPAGALFVAATAYTANQESDYSNEILAINATNRWRVSYRIQMATNLGGPWSNVVTVLLTNSAPQTFYRADLTALPLP